MAVANTLAYYGMAIITALIYQTQAKSDICGQGWNLPEWFFLEISVIISVSQ
jgi:hypothetical protein